MYGCGMPAHSKMQIILLKRASFASPHGKAVPCKIVAHSPTELPQNDIKESQVYPWELQIIRNHILHNPKSTAPAFASNLHEK